MQPRLLFTLGDVAGIGPEIIARAWPNLLDVCQPIVVGDPAWVQRALTLTHSAAQVCPVRHLQDANPTAERVPCLIASTQNLDQVQPGRVSAAAGKAAYDFLCAAIDQALAGTADGIVTAPLHKEGLRAAGLSYPGHTEILAQRTGTHSFAMMLYGKGPAIPSGLGVVHVTLHMALRDVFRQLSPDAILEKIRLVDRVMSQLQKRRPRIGVSALNPHASDGGLFGDEEQTVIQPAVAAAQAEGRLVTGPWPGDTLFLRATQGEFDAIVAMYHDQGHIALKLLAGLHAVNISLGLPIVRTSVAHGTAYDIAGRGVADATGLVEAARVAARLTRKGKGDENHHVSAAARSHGGEPGFSSAAPGPAS
jgi:4-hydroxythreonine-4-phosphate dehydrogenase